MTRASCIATLHLRSRLWLSACFLFVPVAATLAGAADIDEPPIRYSQTPANNPVSHLRAAIQTGQVQLQYESKWGYLRSLLNQLHVPASSQMLVFTKTSLQRDRISPEKPRAIYFNDDVYVGFCQHGKLIEVTAVDPRLGTVYYSLDQKQAAKPKLTRQADTCLICHASSQNNGFPGPLVRSVYADSDGLPVLSMGSHYIDHTSPIAERWGGWYVTGKSGRQSHLGNFVVQDEKQPDEVNNKAGINRTDLRGLCDTRPYLTPYSDIVALMVLEHQTGAHNLMTRANFLTRKALHDEAEINKALGRPLDYRSESTTSRIKNAGEPLVRYLLFSGEAALTDRIEGVSGFTREFAARGPRDHRGRSLRDFDLHRRLFKYPCSYTIYSPAFDGLPRPVREYVLHRLWQVLTGKDASPEFAHLSAIDRRAILEILRDTKKDLPKEWQTTATAAR